MKTLDLDDLADALDGDLSRRSLPIIFAPESGTGAVRVRQSKRKVNREKASAATLALARQTIATLARKELSQAQRRAIADSALREMGVRL